MLRPVPLRRRVAIRLAATVAVLAFSSPVLANAPLENIAPRPHRAPAGATLDDVRESIVQAASELGWHVDESEPERVRVSILDRSGQEATVDIRFDMDTFAIDYVDSAHLGYTETGIGAAKHSQKSSLRRLTTEQVFELGPRIDERYNEWVTRLAGRVARRIAKPRPITPAFPHREAATGEGATGEADPPPRLVADELEKLDALRQRGVLTEAEFQAQKKRLLSR